MPERYYKRYRMEFDLKQTPLPAAELPDGFRWVAWEPKLLESHARIKAECFAGEVDSQLFPCLSNLAGCRRLMSDISSRSNFLPETTWLIEHPNSSLTSKYCGTIQGMRRAFKLGAIQNVGITPDCRGLGLGKALVTKSLQGFAECGIQRVYLDVTAANCTAVALYHSIGFRITDRSYLTLHVPDNATPVAT